MLHPCLHRQNLCYTEDLLLFDHKCVLIRLSYWLNLLILNNAEYAGTIIQCQWKRTSIETRTADLTFDPTLFKRLTHTSCVWSNRNYRSCRSSILRTCTTNWRGFEHNGFGVFTCGHYGIHSGGYSHTSSVRWLIRTWAGVLDSGRCSPVVDGDY